MIIPEKTGEGVLTKKNNAFMLILLAIISAVAFSAVSCSPVNTAGDQDALTRLAETQVTEYQGEKLSSILSFRENSIKGPQDVDIKTYRLKIDGLVQNTAEYTYDEVLANPNYLKVVTLNCVEGWSVKILWEGVKLSDLFNKAGVTAEVNTVIFYAADGYSTSLPLKTVLDRDMLLAYKMNGVVLPPERGFPFQVVAEDKLGYKWCKWVTRIELSNDTSFRGYWEQRGYSNEGAIQSDNVPAQ